ncbi:MAG: glycosyltransferase [Caldilineaceae bacterium]
MAIKHSAADAAKPRRILLLTPQLPYPPHQGTTIRNYGLIRHLAARHTIDLITFLAPDQVCPPDNPLYALCRRIATLLQPVRTLRQRTLDTLRSPLPDMALRLESAAMHTLVHHWLQESVTEPYDLVQIEGIEMAQYGRHALVAGAPRPRPQLIFDDHNCEYLLQQRNALTDLRQPQRWPAAAYSLIQWQKLRTYERRICRQADAVLAVSPVDKAALQQLAPQANITVIANGIDAIKHAAPSAAVAAQPPYQLLFTGKMDYRPNIDAVLWFARQVLPLILAQEPQAHFQIVGMNPHPRLDELRQNPAVTLMGGVASMAPYMQAAAVYVVPLRVGGGTRFKVLEAMAYAKPMVSTTLGVEGIELTNGCELLLADTPDAFAAAVVKLLRDRQQGGKLVQQLSTAARSFVERHYSWQQLIPQLEEVYTQVCSSRQGI